VGQSAGQTVSRTAVESGSCLALRCGIRLGSAGHRRIHLVAVAARRAAPAAPRLRWSRSPGRSIPRGDWGACRKCELDGVEKRVGRVHALLSPLCQAIAANAALVIGDVNRLGWPALHRLDLDRRALQRPVLQKRLHRSSIRRADRRLNTPRSTASRAIAVSPLLLFRPLRQSARRGARCPLFHRSSSGGLVLLLRRRPKALAVGNVRRSTERRRSKRSATQRPRPGLANA
jgi:hypothetical protein